MRRLITIILLISVLFGLSCARMPQKGDHVRVGETVGMYPTFYDGDITDISNGLVCLNCTWSGTVQGESVKSTGPPLFYPFDICIGSGAITSLVWLT
jgi:hypothetical protein